MKNSIRSRIVLSFFSLAIIPLITAGIIISIHSINVQRIQIFRFMKETARQKSSQIYSYFEKLEDEIILISRLKNMAETGEENLPDILAAIVFHHDRQYGAVYEWAAVYDNRGKQLSRVSRLEDDALIVENDKSISAKLEMMEQNNQPLYSRVFFNSTTGEPLMTVYFPLIHIKTGKTVRILVIGFRIKKIWELIAEIKTEISGLVYIINNQNRIIAHPNPSVVLRKTIIERPAKDGIYRGISGKMSIQVTNPLSIGSQQWYLIVENTVNDAFALSRQTLVIIVTLILFSLAAAAILGFLIIRTIATPLESLARAAKTYESGDLTYRVRIHGKDELGKLGDAFNIMARRLTVTINSLKSRGTDLEAALSALEHSQAKLQSSLQKEKELNRLKSEFVSLVSHEFKTPLTIIRSSTEILKTYDGKLDKEKRLTHFDRIQAKVDDMTLLINNVITQEKLEENSRQYNPESFELAPFIDEITESLKIIYKQSVGVTINEQCKEVFLDKGHLKLILGNLLTNGLKYSALTEPVELRVTLDQSWIIFSVQDRGIGIGAEDQKKLFNTFQRGTNVKNIQGTGLGLSIVKKCVDIHKGKIEFESELEKGSTFRVYLPKE